MQRTRTQQVSHQLRSVRAADAGHYAVKPVCFRFFSWSNNNVFPYWQVFIAIESDLERTTRYVEPNIDNYKTYSVAFAQLILSACSEIDVVSKLLCSQIDSNSDP